ncbi:hypothetical protein MUK42_18466, partial [Musa troglodytarum]
LVVLYPPDSQKEKPSLWHTTVSRPDPSTAACASMPHIFCMCAGHALLSCNLNQAK